MLSDTLIVIPARLESMRLPNKPLKLIHGKPMIFWVASKIKKAGICDYLVATDSVQIKNVCKNYGLNVTLTSPHCNTGTDRVAEVANQFSYSYYCNVQGDEPLINVNGVRKFIEQGKLYQGAFVQALTQVRGLNNDSSEVKVALDKKDNIRYLSRLPIPFNQNCNADPKYKCLGLYLYDRNFVFEYTKMSRGVLEQIESIEQLRCIENNARIMGIKVDFDSISIDTQDDLTLVRSKDISLFE